MNSQPNPTASGTEPPSEKQSWWDALIRWLDGMSGLLFLTIGFAGLCSDVGLDRLSRPLFYFTFVYLGLKDLLSCILDLGGRRDGGRIVAVRRWLRPLIFVAPVLLMAAGLAWLLGH